VCRLDVKKLLEAHENSSIFLFPLFIGLFALHVFLYVLEFLFHGFCPVAFVSFDINVEVFFYCFDLAYYCR
jgi:hypothetical protein